MSKLNDDMWERIELNSYSKAQLVHIVNEQADIIRVQHEALKKLSLCEDDSSWGDWVRDIAKTALGGGE